MQHHGCRAGATGPRDDGSASCSLSRELALLAATAADIHFATWSFANISFGPVPEGVTITL